MEAGQQHAKEEPIDSDMEMMADDELLRKLQANIFITKKETCADAGGGPVATVEHEEVVPAGQRHADGLNDDDIDAENLFGSDTSPAGADGDAAEFEEKLQTWQKLFNEDYAFLSNAGRSSEARAVGKGRDRQVIAHARPDVYGRQIAMRKGLAPFGHFRLVGGSSHAWTTSHEEGLRARTGLEKSKQGSRA